MTIQEVLKLPIGTKVKSMMGGTTLETYTVDLVDNFPALVDLDGTMIDDIYFLCQILKADFTLVKKKKKKVSFKELLELQLSSDSYVTVCLKDIMGEATYYDYDIKNEYYCIDTILKILSETFCPDNLADILLNSNDFILEEDN